MVAKVIADYMERVQNRLKGMNENDRNDFLREIQSHIDESYQNDPTTDELDRILAVLRKFGDPDEVVFNRMPQAMVEKGRKKKRPLYIITGILIAILAFPIGVGGVGFVIGLLGVLVGLLAAYFATALVLTLSGFVGTLVSLIYLFFPGVVARINALAGEDVVQFHSFLLNPVAEGILALGISLLIAGLGVLMFYASGRIFRGLRYLMRQIWEGVTRFTKGRVKA
jgi:uncharacterized membrane protein